MTVLSEFRKLYTSPSTAPLPWTLLEAAHPPSPHCGKPFPSWSAARSLPVPALLSWNATGDAVGGPRGRFPPLPLPPLPLALAL